MTIEHLNALPKGTLVGEYAINRVLGAGGFAITYLAYHRTLANPYAVKEFLPQDIVQRRGDSQIQLVSEAVRDDFRYGLNRFLDEARLLAQLRHPSITEAHNFFEANGTAYLVMSYEEGETLESMITRRGGLDHAELQELFLPLLEGVEEVHRTGVLHRDIKPSNIIVRKSGEPVLVDFGAARHAMGRRGQGLTAIASPGYAAPEQYSETAEQGPWTDIYGLAGTAYKAITGEKPIDALNRLMEDHLEPAAQRLQGRFPEAFLHAIDSGLRVAIEDRPRTIAEWRARLMGDAAPPERAAPGRVAEPARFPMPDGRPAAGPPPINPTPIGPQMRRAPEGPSERIPTLRTGANPPPARPRAAAPRANAPLAVALSVVAAVGAAVAAPHVIGTDTIRSTLAAIAPSTAGLITDETRGNEARTADTARTAPDERTSRRESDRTPKAAPGERAETANADQAREADRIRRFAAERAALEQQVREAEAAQETATQQVKTLQAKLAAASRAARDAKARTARAEKEAQEARRLADIEADARRSAEARAEELQRRLTALARQSQDRAERRSTPRRPPGAPPFPSP